MKKKCDNCGSERFGNQKGEIYCKECGEIQRKCKIEQKEYRVFSNGESERKSRFGGSIDYAKPGKGFGSHIGEVYEADSSQRKQFTRMKKWHRRGLERNLQQYFRYIYANGQSLGVTDKVVDESARMIRKLRANGKTKGKNLENSVAAVIYLACKTTNEPRTISEVAEVCGVDEHDLGNIYREFARELDVRILPADPQKLLYRYADRLDITGEALATCVEVIEKSKEENFTVGRSPDSIISGVLYIATREENIEITQEEIANAVGVTEVSLRDSYKTIGEELGCLEVKAKH